MHPSSMRHGTFLGSLCLRPTIMLQLTSAKETDQRYAFSNMKGTASGVSFSMCILLGQLITY